MVLFIIFDRFSYVSHKITVSFDRLLYLNETKINRGLSFALGKTGGAGHRRDTKEVSGVLVLQNVSRMP